MIIIYSKKKLFFIINLVALKAAGMGLAIVKPIMPRIACEMKSQSNLFSSFQSITSYSKVNSNFKSETLLSLQKNISSFYSNQKAPYLNEPFIRNLASRFSELNANTLTEILTHMEKVNCLKCDYKIDNSDIIQLLSKNMSHLLLSDEKMNIDFVKYLMNEKIKKFDRSVSYYNAIKSKHSIPKRVAIGIGSFIVSFVLLP